MTQREQADHLLTLHHGPTPLVMPNPWDVGSAKLLGALGFGGLATTSAGFAATMGRLDGSVTLDEAVVEPAGDDGSGPFLVFLAVPEPKTVKNRVHLDLGSDDLDAQREMVERLVAAGARRVDVGQGDAPWIVLADPEANELCVVPPDA